MKLAVIVLAALAAGCATTPQGGSHTQPASAAPSMGPALAEGIRNAMRSASQKGVDPNARECVTRASGNVIRTTCN